MNAKIPEVTVIMACYNAEDSVSLAIQSILNQTFSNFKFIVVDDGSKDSTASVLEEWSLSDDRIDVLRNKQNKGLSASLNRAIDLVETPFIARMDADDEALPNRLQLQFDYMQSHPNVDVLGSAVLTRSGNDKECSGKIPMPSSHEEIVSRVFKKSLVLHPTIMIKTEVYKRIGTYDNTVRWAEDADLWYRIYDQVTWANLESPLLKYTVKSKLTRKIIYNNLKVKITNLKRRGLLLSHSPIIALDLLNYAYISLKQIIIPR
ncbi:MAG: glycosyltransferase involved in cell wall biosynthesis [Saprospiraceae bacterium]|jgi:glycosyltransferase involved in cell wall biosynthesis